MIKANKIIFTFFAAAILSLPTAGCGSRADMPVMDNSDVKLMTASSSETETDTDADDAGSPETYQTDVFYVKEGQEAGLEEEVEYGGCAWVVSDVTITKEIGDRPQADFIYWGEEKDDSGNLTGNKNYIFVTISCKNLGDDTREGYLNSFRFVTIDESGQICGADDEARYINTAQKENGDPAKMFRYLLEPGKETGQIEIGYIIEDSYIDGSVNLYYCIGAQGSMLDSPDNRYIKVDTER